MLSGNYPPHRSLRTKRLCVVRRRRYDSEAEFRWKNDDDIGAGTPEYSTCHISFSPRIQIQRSKIESDSGFVNHL